MDVFETFGIQRIVNCCGIYTDLGGSVLSSTVWQACQELNGTYVRMTDLMDSAGEMIASLSGAEAARPTPGASAAIALAVGATITGDVGSLCERLPDVTGLKHEVVIAASHLRNYKYANCIRMTGARLVAAGPKTNFELASLCAAISPQTCCIFVPVHLLDGFRGTAQLQEIVKIARGAGVPVVIDAAYMSYPTQLIREYVDAGVDLACFSAKYFFGPNSGGFIIGRTALIQAVEALDFTRFESGPFRKFGRPFKMGRYEVAATALAFREWMTMDHAERWKRYARMAEVIRRAAARPKEAVATKLLFTMSEELVDSDTVNCVAVKWHDGKSRKAQRLADYLAAENPGIATIPLSDTLIIAVDALLPGQEELVVDRLANAFAKPNSWS